MKLTTMSRVQPSHDIELTWDQALAWRVSRHHLTNPSRDPVRLAGDLAGVQAQVPASTLQVLTIRGTQVPDLDALLWDERELVKTWAMRGTLHLLPTSELDVWIAALRQREWKITPAWERYHGTSAAQLDAITRAIPEVLTDSPLTRDELTDAIVASVGDPGLREPLSSGWSQLLKPAANQGLLAQGPPRGRNTTFVALFHWVSSSSEPAPEVAMATIVERFLDGYGPATTADFARWFGVDPKSGRELMTAHLDGMVPVSVEGHLGWLTPGGAKDASRAEPSREVMLLPGFDPFTLAPLSHRDHIIPEGQVDRVSRAAGRIAPVILEGGRIVGTWGMSNESKLILQPFAELSKRAVSAIEEHVERRYQGLLGTFDLVVDRP